MIKLQTAYISYNQLGDMYKLWKNGGIISIGNLGIHVQPKKGYMEVSVVGFGEELDHRVYVNQLRETKPKPKLTEIEKGSSDLFDDLDLYEGLIDNEVDTDGKCNI